MKQLPIRGASAVTPSLSQDELKRALSGLGVIAVYSDEDISKLYRDLASVYGAWMAEQESKQVSAVTAALRETGKNLIKASRLLNGRATGLRSQVEFEVTTQVIAILKRNPELRGADASQMVGRFQADAKTVGEGCLVAYADLSRKAANEGRWLRSRSSNISNSYGHVAE